MKNRVFQGVWDERSMDTDYYHIQVIEWNDYTYNNILQQSPDLSHATLNSD